MSHVALLLVSNYAYDKYHKRVGYSSIQDKIQFMGFG